MLEWITADWINVAVTVLAIVVVAVALKWLLIIAVAAAVFAWAAREDRKDREHWRRARRG